MGNQMELPPFTTKGTTFSKTCLNGINALLGIGLITIPYTLSKAGWLSVVFLLAMAIITCYTCFLLQRCLDSNPAIKTYEDIASHAFGRKGKLIISTFMYLELYLVPTGFLITESDNLYKLFPNIGFRVGSHYIGGKKFFTLVSGLVILPTMWLKNLSLLSFVSAGGVFSSVVIICSIFWAGAFNGVGFSSRGKLFEFSGIPTALSLYAFCYGAHAVFPTLYTSMKDKSRFSKVLFLSFGLSTVCYVAIGVIGYLMFGEKAQSQVTLNLPTNAISSKVAIYTSLVGPVAKYALIITPISEAIEAHLPEVLNIRPIWMLLRALLLATTMIAALSFPYFGVVMAFVGAVLNVAVSVLFPCICYLKLCGSHKKWGFEEMVILGIVVMAISLAAVGTFSAVKDITCASKSRFLSGSTGKLNRSLSVKPVVSSSSTSFKVVAKKGEWLPGLPSPSYLNGSLAGDNGFDPLGLAEDPENLRWFVQAELVNGRWAMLGVAGMLLPEVLTSIRIINAPKWYDAGKAEYFASSSTLFAIAFILFHYVEIRRWQDIKNPGSLNQDPIFKQYGLPPNEVGYPGGIFNPLNFQPTLEAKEKEIANGRLAMLAFLGFVVQHNVTGKGPFDNLLQHLSDPWHSTIVQTFSSN